MNSLSDSSSLIPNKIHDYHSTDFIPIPLHFMISKNILDLNMNFHLINFFSCQKYKKRFERIFSFFSSKAFNQIVQFHWNRTASQQQQIRRLCTKIIFQIFFQFFPKKKKKRRDTTTSNNNQVFLLFLLPLHIFKSLSLEYKARRAWAHAPLQLSHPTSLPLIYPTTFSSSLCSLYTFQCVLQQ